MMKHIPVYGLVLAGGNSSRMGKAKRLIPYHGIPQQEYVLKLLESTCERAFISLQEGVAEESLPESSIITDHPDYSGSGPVAGLLSAFRKFPDVAWCIAGCDYPFLDLPSVQQLIAARDGKHHAYVFWNRDARLPEPLIGLYEPQVYPGLLTAYQNGNESLRHFLGQANALYMFPSSPRIIQSVDTPEAFGQIAGIIRSLSIHH